jgi:hypothetical protein
MTEVENSPKINTGEDPKVVERKIFKGTQRVVEELHERPQFAVFQNLEIEDKERKGKLPKMFILSKVEKSNTNPNKVYLEYYTGHQFKKGNTYVARDLKLQELEGTQGKKVVENFHQYRLTDVSRFLVKPSMFIGADPEIFVVDKNNSLIPAFNFLGGKNDANPDRAPHVGDAQGRKVYWDGFQAEFETKPETCLAYEVDSIQAGLKAIYEKAKAKYPGAKLSMQSVVELTDKQMETTDPKYLELGCDPSFNAYSIKGRDLNGRETSTRAAGGHMHFGIGQKSEEAYIEIVKCLDAVAGVASVSLFAGMENPLRREYYGLAGEYRKPPHGLEWRTPSNAWLCHPTIAHVFFDLARRAVYLGLGNLRGHFQATDDEVVEIIQTCNVEKAREVLKRNKGLYMSLLKDCYGNETVRSENAFNLLLQGVGSIIKDPFNMTENWSLEGTWLRHSNNSKVCWANRYSIKEKF